MILFLYIYLGIGALAVAIYVVNSLINHRRDWTDQNIRQTLEDARAYSPVRQQFIAAFGSRIGVCIIVLLTWPYGAYLLWESRK
jgi:hypothetical protein